MSMATAWDLWRTLQRSPSAIETRQRQRLAELIAFARATSPYYRARYRDLPSENVELQMLPPVRKADLMAHFDDTLTDPAVTRADVEAFMTTTPPGSRLYRDRYLLCTTSGTTGRPGIFLHDATARAIYAAILLARTLPAHAWPRGLAAFVRRGGRVTLAVAPEGYSIEAALMGYGSARYPRLIGRYVRMLSLMRPLSEVVQALNGFQPAILVGYATALAWLAEQQVTGSLHIDPLLLVTTAEWLAPPERERMAAHFHCPVRDLYAATEFPGIAAECDHGLLHVNSDWVILEPVDEAYRSVPPGQPAYTTLLTNLTNRVQPLIRYDLGDSITLLERPCPCGSTLPTIRLEGRCDEMLRFHTPEGVVIPILPLALTSVVSMIPGVQRFQLLQTGRDALQVRLEAAHAEDRTRLADDVVRRMKTYFATQGVFAIHVAVAPEAPARDATTGKYRAVWAEPAAQA